MERILKMKQFLRALAVCAALAVLTVVTAAAATPAEMYENGVVSDGNISYHDARDGIVSDVSEAVGDDMNEIRNGFDSRTGENGSEQATGTHTGDDAGLNDNLTGDTGMNGAENGTAASSATSNSTAQSAATPNGADGTDNTGRGLAWGVIVAIIVIVIVIVVIFLLMPKRRG